MTKCSVNSFNKNCTEINEDNKAVGASKTSVNFSKINSVMYQTIVAFSHRNDKNIHLVLLLPTAFPVGPKSIGVYLTFRLRTGIDIDIVPEKLF